MAELKIFNNAEFGEIRTVMIDGEPWFVAKDVATALGFNNSRDAVANHVFKEDKGVESIDTLGGRQKLTIINESGLYALVFGSRLSSAKNFKRWVTSEVLPSIRKHGLYAVDELVNNPDMLIKALTALKEERERTRVLTEENEVLKPKAVFSDAVAGSKDSILIGDLAKLLKQNGISIGQKRLFDWLRENGYLIKKGDSKNMPIQRYMERGLFEIKETAIGIAGGEVKVSRTTKVTGKGQVYFINKFLKAKKMLEAGNGK